MKPDLATEFTKRLLRTAHMAEDKGGIAAAEVTRALIDTAVTFAMQRGVDLATLLREAAERIEIAAQPGSRH